MSQLIASIDMTLDMESVKEAIQKVELIQSRLVPAMQCLIDYLGERGEEVAKAMLVLFDQPAWDSGALHDSIKYEKKDGEGIVSAGEGLTNAMGEPTNYAVYVEYGNRIKHPNGWWYPDPNGTYIPKKGPMKGQPMSFTTGMPARPFMINTRNELRYEAEKNGGRIIAEYIRGERA